MTRPIGYIVTAYPGVSHTFVMREVQALRRRGTPVRTYSVHAAPPRDVLSEDDVEEAASTANLLPTRAADVLAAVLLVAAPHPLTFVRAVAAAVSRGRGVRGRIWQCFYFAEALLLLRHCRRDGVRHLHAHFANNAADIARTTVDLGQRLDGAGSWSWSFTMHGPTEFEDPARFGLAGKVRDADFVACISHYCRQRLEELVEPGDRPELVLVRCGLDLERFPVVDRTPEHDALRILCVGRLVAEKGQEVLVAAVAELHGQGVPVELVLVGEGPHRGVIEAEIATFGLEDVVTLQGSVGQDEILAWYAWADVFALLSYAEGLPVVLMEAMATGLPVVTTRIAGIPELVCDGESGFVVTPGSVLEATEALRRLAQEQDLALLASRNARRAVEAQHDIGNCVIPLDEVLRRRWPT